MKPIYYLSISFTPRKGISPVVRNYRVAKKEDVFTVHEALKDLGKNLQVTFTIDHIMKPEEILQELEDNYGVK